MPRKPTKRLVEDSLKLSIRELSKKGLMNSDLSKGNLTWPYKNPITITFLIGKQEKLKEDERCLILFYSLNRPNGYNEQVKQVIFLKAHRLCRGGIVWKLICPLCRRKGEVLYLPLGQKRFACRDCHNLTYRSCREHDKRISFYMRNLDITEAVLNGWLDWGPKQQFLAARAILKRVHKEGIL